MVRRLIRSARGRVCGPLVALWVAGGLLGGCAAMPSTTKSAPRNVSDACAIFRDQSGWYQESLAAQRKWGVPVSLQLAFIHQESGFRHDAQPPRSSLFWFIPASRPSTAYGYAQALESTWSDYRKKSGARNADRDDFGDSVDFIGWYVDQSQRVCGIPKSEVREQYLAYHEGHRGYNRKNYLKKPWLLKVADRVERNAARYQEQLNRCRPEQNLVSAH